MSGKRKGRAIVPNASPPPSQYMLTAFGLQNGSGFQRDGAYITPIFGVKGLGNLHQSFFRSREVSIVVARHETLFRA